MAAKKKTVAARLAERSCEFVGREDIPASVALESLRIGRAAQFASESEYRDWFVREALPDVMPQITGGELIDARLEHRIRGGAVRLDVFARADNGRAVGFELKATNMRSPQTARYALVAGIGQALLYQDMLSAAHGVHVPVFLVSDIVAEDVASLLLRHGLMIGLMEANPERVLCMGRCYGRQAN